jgi:hypothetical protein
VFGDDLIAYLPEHVRKFSEQLKQFPHNYEKWVHATMVPREIYQGDVLAETPLVYVDESGAPNSTRLPGMVISCTCDVQPGQGEVALVASVFDFEDYRANSALKGKELDDHLRAVIDNKISNLLFLPRGLGLGKPSVVDLGSVTSVSVDYIQSSAGSKRLTSLSQLGHYFFLIKLAYHLTRPESSDAVRV